MKRLRVTSTRKRHLFVALCLFAVAQFATWLGAPAQGAVLSDASLPPVINAHGIADTNWGNVCSVDVRGKVTCWGSDVFGVGVAEVPQNLGAAIDVQVGTAHACALLIDHSVRCWGAQGHSGWPAHGQTEVPADLGPVVSISVGDYHSCAQTINNSVRCWGLDLTHGQNQSTGLPGNLGPVARITAGGQVTCALLQSRGVRCSESSGNLATMWVDRTDLAAVSVAGRSPNAVLCVVTVAGQVECVGNPLYETGQAAVPANLPPALDVEAGAFETCALLRDGTVRCWGWSRSGATTVPPSLVGVSSVTADAGIGCAVTRREALTCWGSGSSVPDNLLVQIPLHPSILTAIGAANSAEISWATPTDDGGASVLAYTVTASPGGQTCTTSGLSCIVTGLTNRQSYTFTVTATNSAGTSEPSVPSAAVIPLAPGFQVWPVNSVVRLGGNTTLLLAQAAARSTVAITGSAKVTVSADANGFGSSVFSATKAGIQKFTATYSVKVGKKTTKYTATTQLYVPSVSGPMMTIKQNKTGKFSLQFMPPGAAISIELSDGRTLTGAADSAGKASFTPTFSSLGALSYTVTVAGVQVGTGGLTVTK